MSCFIVDDAGVNRVVSLFRENFSACEDLDKLGLNLKRMNLIAYHSRYQSEAGRFEELSFRYQLKNEPLIQSLKSAECLLYQCSELGVQGSFSNEFKMLEEKIVSVKHEIVSGMKEYQEADWG